MIGIVIIALDSVLDRQLRPAAYFVLSSPPPAADVANVPTVLPKVVPPTTTHSRNLYSVEALSP